MSTPLCLYRGRIVRVKVNPIPVDHRFYAGHVGRIVDIRNDLVTLEMLTGKRKGRQFIVAERWLEAAYDYEDH